MDTSVDRKFPNDCDSASIFSKVIGCELYHGSSADLYSCCRMDFAINDVRTKASYFVELGLPAINTSDEFNILGTPATRIRMSKGGYRWSALDHVFWEATAVEMSATRS